MSFIVLGSFLPAAASCAESSLPMLSPPPFTFANKVKYTLGMDPDVTVHDIKSTGGGKHLIHIDVKNLDKLQALDTIIKSVYSLGNEEVRIQFHSVCGDSSPHHRSTSPVIPWTTKSVEKIINTAFRGNPLFYMTKDSNSFGHSAVNVIFQKAIVQFWNDDLSDYYSNYNEVAAFVFRQLMVSRVGNILLGASTRDDACGSTPDSLAEVAEW